MRTITNSMSKVQSNDGEEACIVCFRKHIRCDGTDGSRCTPCSRAVSKAIPAKARLCCLISDSKLYVGREFRSHPAPLNPWLATSDGSVHVLTLHFESNSKVGEVVKSNKIEFAGPFCVTNLSLVNQIDKMFQDIWDLEIEANHEVSLATRSVYNYISYINVAFCAEFTNKSIVSQDMQDLSAVVIRFVLLRICELAVEISDMVPNRSGDIDANLRPGLDTLYLFLSTVTSGLSRLGRSSIYNDVKLFKSFKNQCHALYKWLGSCLQMDCETEVSWGDGFSGSKKSLLRKIDIMGPVTLSLDIILKDGSLSNSAGVYSTRSASTSSPPLLDGGDGFDNIFGSPLETFASTSNHLPELDMCPLRKLSSKSPDTRSYDSSQHPLTPEADFGVASGHQMFPKFNVNEIGLSDHNVPLWETSGSHDLRDFLEHDFGASEPQASIINEPLPGYNPNVFDAFGNKSPDMNFTNAIFALPQYGVNGVNGVDESNEQGFISFHGNHSYTNANPTLVTRPAIDSEMGSSTFPLIDVTGHLFGESVDTSIGIVNPTAENPINNMTWSSNTMDMTQPYTPQDNTCNTGYVNPRLLHPEPRA